MQEATWVVESVDSRGRCGENEEPIKDAWPRAEVISDRCEYENAVVTRPDTVDLNVDQIGIIVRNIEPPYKSSQYV